MFLTLSDITKRFGATTALDSVSLAVEEGEFVCFLGPSGCGKTTLLRIVAGLEIADSGNILLRDRDLARTPARLRNFGVVFQSYSLFPNMTVARNVAYGLECRRRPAAAVARRVTEMLELVQLTDQAPKHPHQLSGGQQQRVALARALAPEPSVLLLDEPLSALDAKVREDLRGEMRELQRRLGITTIMVTHDQDEAMEMADRIVVMDGGRIAQVGNAVALYNTPVSRFVAEFIGRMNVVRLSSQGEARTLAGLPVEIDAGAGLAAGGTLIGVRPEEVEIAPAGAAGANIFPGTVARTVFLGNVTRMTVDVDDQQLLVEMRGNHTEIVPGRELSVVLRPSALHLLQER
jgi:iron(III) transport system ATP-binding protein